MSIVFRYLTKQVLVSMLAVTGILLLIFMSGRFIKYLAEAAAGNLSADVLFIIMAYRLPSFLELILPMAFFLGVLLSYGRMYLESEMTVLSATGLSQARLVRMTVMSALVVGLVVALMSLVLSPWGILKVEQIFVDQSKITEFELLAPGRFQSLKSGERVTYTEGLSADKKRLERVFIAENNREKDQVATVVAEYGTQFVDPDTGTRYLQLHNGARYEGVPGQFDYRIAEFETYQFKVAEPAGKRIRDKDEAIPTRALLQRDDPRSAAVLQWRLSLPLVVPVVAIIAVALSRVNPRQGRFFHLLPAMLIYIAYVGLLIVARDAVEKEKLPAWLGVWWVHLLFIGFGLMLAFGREWRMRLGRVEESSHA